MFKKKKQKNPETFTSPKPVEHFDLREPEAVICCRSCREPLWEMVVRTAAGTVVSTKTLPVGRNSCAFDEKNDACPLCNQRYFTGTGKDKRILIRATKTGHEFIL